MKVTAVVNQKGGVGKTAITFHLTWGLAQKGLRVLCIDLDPQGHLSGAFRQTGCSALNIFDENPRIEAHPVRPNIFVVSSSPDLMKMDARLSVQTLFKLRKALRSVRDFDMVVADCPPNLGVLTLNGLCAATSALIPVAPNFFSLRALDELWGLLGELREEGLNQHLQSVGIVRNFWERTLVCREVDEILSERFRKELLTVKIPKSVRVEEALQEGRPVWEVEPNATVSAAFRDFINEFLEREGL